MGLIMKLLTALFILLAVSAFGANPDYKSFRGIGGIDITTNPPNGLIIIDGSGISSPTGGVSAATATNIALYFGTNSIGLPAPPLSSIQFNSNGVMQGSAGFVFTNGNVGIATNVPSEKLQVNGSIYATSIAPIYGFTTAYGKLPLISYPIEDSAFIGPKTGNLTVSDVYGGTAGARNTAIGNSVLYSLTTGHRNLGVGFNVMGLLTSGTYNTIVGMSGLADATIANHNSGLGHHVLRQATGDYNVAMGDYVLETGVTGNGNVGMGYSVLQQYAGSSSVAIGFESGKLLASGNANVLIGAYSSGSATYSIGNTIVGYASYGGVAGSYNTGLGSGVFGEANTGDYNVGVGQRAGAVITGTKNTILGSHPSGGGITSGSFNVIIGYQPDLITPTGNGQLNIGNLIFGTALESGTTLSTGNIGIGTTVPSSKLDVIGQVRAESAIITNTLDVTQGTGTALIGTLKVMQSAGIANGYFTNVVAAYSGVFYPTNITANLPTAASLGVGGYWIGNSNGTLVAMWSVNGTTSSIKVLAP